MNFLLCAPWHLELWAELQSKPYLLLPSPPLGALLRFSSTSRLLQVPRVCSLWLRLPLSQWPCLFLAEVMKEDVAKCTTCLKMEQREDILLLIPARPCFLPSLTAKHPCQEGRSYKHFFCH